MSQSANNTVFLDHMRRLCSTSERCTKDVLEKLRKLNFEGDTEAIIKTLISEGFINEERYAQSVVNDKAKFSKWGKAKIRYFLKGKGIADLLIDKALENLPDEDYKNIITRELEKKLKTIKETDKLKRKQKLIMFAFQRGYDSEIVYKVIDNIIP
jgi:regulatory protein